MAIYDIEEMQIEETEESIEKCLRDTYGIEIDNVVEILEDCEFVKMDHRYAVKKGSFGVVDWFEIDSINDDGTVNYHLDIYCPADDDEVSIQLKYSGTTMVDEKTGKEIGDLIKTLDDNSEIAQAVNEYGQACDRYTYAKSKYSGPLDKVIKCLGIVIIAIASTLIEIQLFKYLSPGVHLVAYTDVLDLVFGAITLPVVLVIVGALTFGILNNFCLEYDDTPDGKKLRKEKDDALSRIKELDKKYCA